MPRQRAPRRVTQERNSQGYLAWVQHLLDVEQFAFSSVSGEQRDRLHALLWLISQIHDASTPMNREAFHELISSGDAFGNYTQLRNWVYPNYHLPHQVWSEVDSGFASEAEAIQALTVLLTRLLAIVRRV